ncbi:hypothetical protein M0Q50_00990 [bacterium]|jgi:hypothetical protein|nr:hypothetical protein [bacterium]
MNLIKVKTIQVYGYDGSEYESVSYVIGEVTDEPYSQDDEPYSQDDVVEHDELYLEYNKYINLGEISEHEEDILSKFGII